MVSAEEKQNFVSFPALNDLFGEIPGNQKIRGRALSTRLIVRGNARLSGGGAEVTMVTTGPYPPRASPRHCKFCQMCNARTRPMLYLLGVRYSGFQSAPRMKISLSRSSILTALAIAVLLAALPGAIQRLVRTGDPYLLTRQFIEDMLARLSGAGRLRFIFQPMTALFIGMRDGMRDFRLGCPPFLSALVSHQGHRKKLLLSAFASVRDLVAIAIILDVISQFLIFRDVHPGAALLLGPALITVPYSISRALANRIARRRSQPTPVIRAS
jgi:hypothetical protein